MKVPLIKKSLVITGLAFLSIWGLSKFATFFQVVCAFLSLPAIFLCALTGLTTIHEINIVTGAVTFLIYWAVVYNLSKFIQSRGQRGKQDEP